MKKSLVSISSVLEDLFKKKSSHFSEIYFLLQLKQIWNQIVGNQISKWAIPSQFKNKNLYLNLPDSTHLQEMHFAKETLKDKINSRFPSVKINKIILTVKNKSFK
ncbi:MAG: DUF721 domain-containing protein [Bdellovibrionaceae bacterium]|nr:DUF721 domain-containing protein [Pseudobdellovibrionaceae bacterium]